MPNRVCLIIKNASYNIYGEPERKERIREKCTVINAGQSSKKSSVRADSSASRGNAQEIVADYWLLLTHNTCADIDDLIEIDGMQLKIVSLIPRYDLRGKHDHTEALCTMWNEIEVDA